MLRNELLSRVSAPGWVAAKLEAGSSAFLTGTPARNINAQGVVGPTWAIMLVVTKG